MSYILTLSMDDSLSLTLSMDDSLSTVLQVHNPWLRKPGTQRTALSQMLPGDWIDRTRTIELRAGGELVVGPRQAGKTSLIRQALSRQPDPVLVFVAEEPRIRQLCVSPAEALHTLHGLLSPETILFFDEVQHLTEALLFIKGLIDLDPRRRVLITGSSSFHLGAKTRESLAGRVRRLRLLPFSLQEVAATVPGDLLPAMREKSLRELWGRLMVFGGYPGTWNVDDPGEALHRLVEAFVLKDVSDLHTIDHPSALRTLLRLAAADIGNLVNMNAWASEAGVSRNTVVRYLDIVAQAHVIELVQPFVGGKRAEITGTSKIFFLDNGLRNALFGGFAEPGNRADHGALFENAVFTEIAKTMDLLDEVLFWRSKNGAEVDFVIRRGDRLMGIEAKAGALQAPAVSRSARSFIDAYRPKVFAVINAALRYDTNIDGVPVWFRRPWEIPEVLAFSH